MTVEQVKAYELMEKHKIQELDSTSYLLRHKKTGARVFLMENEDPNKVFYIGFRTPARCCADRSCFRPRIPLWSWPRALSIHS